MTEMLDNTTGLLEERHTQRVVSFFSSVIIISKVFLSEHLGKHISASEVNDLYTVMVIHSYELG